MMALCRRAQVRPTVKKRARTISGSLVHPPEKTHISAGIVSGDAARRDAVLQPCAQVESNGGNAGERQTENRQLLQHVRRPEGAEYCGPSERTDDGFHPHHTKALRLDLAPQAFGRPAPV